MDDYGPEATPAAPERQRGAEHDAASGDARTASPVTGDTERAQRREQILFERERVAARRRAQRAAGAGVRPGPPTLSPARPSGEEFEAGWWSVERSTAADAGAGAAGATASAQVPPAQRPAEDGPAPTVTVPVAVPMTVPADVWRGPEGYSLDLDLPGVDPASVGVAFAGGVLTISAERRGQLVQGRAAVLLERPVGTVTRQVQLPEDVDTAAAHIGYRDGVLSVSLPVTGAGARVIDLSQGAGHDGHRLP
ncbi:Hsp20/alpha crystallin family protein [Kineococcus xinjiangensis]|uniref:Hsp20/alpha crystallin family protein n=1 Tax=Kineococcus xinjiangensis TaxID=512762 RepID=A0A2S6ICD5_9ACTN|nr:Hsp20/alpha crystallin family protein [Kineococcus xinjiangensis]PPK90893.1 Hsp20/alpha crystallin family protein [Kineococcus xinjiangensis]